MQIIQIIQIIQIGLQLQDGIDFSLDIVKLGDAQFAFQVSSASDLGLKPKLESSILMPEDKNMVKAIGSVVFIATDVTRYTVSDSISI